MPLRLFIGSPKRLLCAAVFYCLVLGRGLSNAETLATPFSLPNCSDGFQPQPIFTPKAMLEINGLRVLVDLIVNAQGRIESPLILESSGETNAKQTLGIIQQWRFRPAICNGVPTNIELRVLFEGPRQKLPQPVVCVGQSTHRERVPSAVHVDFNSCQSAK